MLNAQYGQTDLLVDINMNSDASSSAYSIKQIVGYSIQHVWSAGSASRSALIVISVSNKENGTYTAIDSHTINTSEGNRLVNVELSRYNFVKVEYTSLTPGGGTITSNITTRSI